MSSDTSLVVFCGILVINSAPINGHHRCRFFHRRAVTRDTSTARCILENSEKKIVGKMRFFVKNQSFSQIVGQNLGHKLNFKSKFRE